MQILWAVFLLVSMSGFSVANAERPPSAGRIVTSVNRERVRSFVPPEFAPHVLDANDGLHITIGERRDYTPHPDYVNATTSFGCQSALEPEGHLTGFTAGQPFPFSDWAVRATQGQCTLDPENSAFATALAWNMAYRWQGSGLTLPVFALAYLEDKGAAVQRIAVGEYRRTYFSHRADLGDTDWMIEPETKTVWAELLTIRAPFDLRGTMFLSYHYDEPDRDLQTWAYIPELRRVRRVAAVRRGDPFLRSELSLEDFYLFSGRVDDFIWTYKGEQLLLAAIGSRDGCYPIDTPAEKAAEGWAKTCAVSPPEDEWKRVGAPAPQETELTEGFSRCQFAPYNALPFGGGQRFEARSMFELEAVPRATDHATSARRLWVDRQTMLPMYAAVFDKEKKLQKLITQVFDWEEDKRILLPKAIGSYNVQTGAAALGQFHSADARDYTLEEVRRFYATTRYQSRCR